MSEDWKLGALPPNPVWATPSTLPFANASPLRFDFGDESARAADPTSSRARSILADVADGARGRKGCAGESASHGLPAGGGPRSW